VEATLNSTKDKYAIHHYLQPDGKPLSNILGVQAERLDPGTSVESQESHSYLYHCYEGKGRTEVQAPSGETFVFNWVSRDTFAVPSWSKIKHVNESKTEKAYLVACHDGPLLDCLGLRRPN
jgi:gentisate 1,2-dioxygenase